MLAKRKARRREGSVKDGRKEGRQRALMTEEAEDKTAACPRPCDVTRKKVVAPLV